MVKRNRKTGKNNSNKNTKRSRTTRRSQRGGEGNAANTSNAYNNVYGNKEITNLQRKIQERSNKRYGGAFSHENAINMAHKDMERKQIPRTVNGYTKYIGMLLNMNTEANGRNATLRSEAVGNASYM